MQIVILSYFKSVDIATGLWAGRLDDRDSIPGGGWEFFSSTPCPDRFWALPASCPVDTGVFPWE